MSHDPCRFSDKIKNVSFAPSVDFSKGGASQYSLFLSEESEVQKARLMLKMKGYEKDITDVEYKIQELLYDIEVNDAECRKIEKGGLPEDWKRMHLNLTRLYNSKRYCQIEVLKIEKQILVAQSEQEKQRYMDSLKPQSCA